MSEVLMYILSEVIPIWGLEKITRQYLGFSDLVIKEYHDTLTLAVHAYDPNMICSKKTKKILFQWRGQDYAKWFPYIYNTRMYFDTTLSREQLINREFFKNYEILGWPVKFYKDY